MALKPVLKLKVDELFLRWLSEAETQTVLKANLRQILKGEPLSKPTTNHVAPSSKGPQSPRGPRPSSPSTPPCSPTVSVSPRSPRRPYNKGLQRHLNNNSKVPKEAAPTKPVEVTPARREEPEGQSDFLSQKQKQLQQKKQQQEQQREGEQQKQQPKQQQPSPSVQGSKPDPEPSSGVSTVDSSGKANSKRTLQNGAPANSIKNSAPVADSSSTGVVKGQKVAKDAVTPSQPPTKSQPAKPSSAKRSSKQQSVAIPKFYFPCGLPASDNDKEAIAQKIKEVFSKAEDGKLQKAQIPLLTKACGLPAYWKCPLFRYSGGEKHGYLTLQNFLAAWTKLVTNCHDDASKFMRMMAKPGRNYLEEDDFIPLIQDVVDAHSGLSFLQDAPEFHSRYVQTVISRIMYSVNRSWSGKISIYELRRSTLLQTLLLLEEEEDINQVTDFFSYEHFYVIYCKFWELDKDHDLYISKDDLTKHNDHAISSKMIERIFCGAVTRHMMEGKMNYKDFVWFLISEEDKKHPTSIEYWFRCMDIDGDGVISMYEMEYFYTEQVLKMEAIGIETLPFEDCLCQMLDMVKPQKEGQITLRDLKACKMTPIFFDTFFNLEKYLEHEQKDPFANVRDGEGDEPEMTDWERYAADEYEVLVAEEGANDPNQEEIMYEDDFEADDDELSPKGPPGIDGKASDAPQRKGPANRSATTDDIYDFSKSDLGSSDDSEGRGGVKRDDSENLYDNPDDLRPNSN